MFELYIKCVSGQFAREFLRLVSHIRVHQNCSFAEKSLAFQTSSTLIFRSTVIIWYKLEIAVISLLITGHLRRDSISWPT